MYKRSTGKIRWVQQAIIILIAFLTHSALAGEWVHRTWVDITGQAMEFTYQSPNMINGRHAIFYTSQSNKAALHHDVLNLSILIERPATSNAGIWHISLVNAKTNGALENSEYTLHSGNRIGNIWSASNNLCGTLWASCVLRCYKTFAHANDSLFMDHHAAPCDTFEQPLWISFRGTIFKENWPSFVAALKDANHLRFETDAPFQFPLTHLKERMETHLSQANTANVPLIPAHKGQGAPKHIYIGNYCVDKAGEDDVLWLYNSPYEPKEKSVPLMPKDCDISLATYACRYEWCPAKYHPLAPTKTEAHYGWVKRSGIVPGF